MSSKLTIPAEPMEALLVAELPGGPGWQYEPKWDGFRCLAWRDGDAVGLISKSGKPLARYFPEVAAMITGLARKRLLIDGELIVALGERLSFDALQARLHPAASRVEKLARETPAALMAFDCLDDGRALADRPLAERRVALEEMVAAEQVPSLLLSPCTREVEVARSWLERSGGALDGVVAKRLADPYRPGERAMAKVKLQRIADCVVGGFRHDRAGAHVASLLLGLYNDEGLLDHVGFTSAIPVAERARWTAELEALVAPPGFTGKAPGGPSRWSSERSTEWQPLRPEIVVEVRYDQITDQRFRHATGLIRRRPDKAPRQCTMHQLRHELRPAELARLLDR